MATGFDTIDDRMSALWATHGRLGAGLAKEFRSLRDEIARLMKENARLNAELDKTGRTGK